MDRNMIYETAQCWCEAFTVDTQHYNYPKGVYVTAVPLQVYSVNMDLHGLYSVSLPTLGLVQDYSTHLSSPVKKCAKLLHRQHHDTVLLNCLRQQYKMYCIVLEI